MRINIGLFSNLDYEPKSTRTKTWCKQNKNSTKFYYGTKIIQDYKKYVLKIGVEHIKNNEIFLFIFIFFMYLVQIFKKFTCGPCLFTCVHVWTISELKFNSKWIST